MSLNLKKEFLCSYTARGHNLRFFLFCSQPASARAISETPVRTRAESDSVISYFVRNEDPGDTDDFVPPGFIFFVQLRGSNPRPGAPPQRLTIGRNRTCPVMITICFCNAEVTKSRPAASLRYTSLMRTGEALPVTTKRRLKIAPSPLMAL